MNEGTYLTCDISPLLRFHFWQHVYFNLDYSNFPSYSTEETRRFVGISENVGHVMTFSILNMTTNKVIIGSNFRPAGEPSSSDFRIEPLIALEVVKSLYPPSTHLEGNEEPHSATEQELHNTSNYSSKKTMPIIDPNDLVGRNFLIPQAYGKRLRAGVVKALDDHEGDL